MLLKGNDTGGPRGEPGCKKTAIESMKTVLLKGFDIKRTLGANGRSRRTIYSAAIKLSERILYWNDPDYVRLAKHMLHQTRPDLK